MENDLLLWDYWHECQPQPDETGTVTVTHYDGDGVQVASEELTEFDRAYL